MGEPPLRPVLTVRLFTEKKCFGPGIAALLHKVEEHHSLRAAAMDMNMAYSKAWTIIKNAEQELGFKLLLTSTGGKNGGGASLTEEGSALLTAYDGYCEALDKASRELFSKFFPDSQ